MRKACRHIKGFDSDKKIYDRKVALSHLSEDQLRSLLKALVAKAGLNFDEIVGAYARRQSTIANDLLAVRRDGPHPVFTCGENPHSIAKVIQE
jgi:hypothetical protein